MQHHPGLYIAPSEERGIGVFTGQDIAVADIIEICPVILIPSDNLQLIDQTIVYQYYFIWPDETHKACIALGYGSIYNHSFHPNAEVITDKEFQTITFKCTRSIPAGSEIFIDYCGGEVNRDKLWFQPV